MMTANPSEREIDDLATLLNNRLKSRVGDLACVLRMADATQRLADQLDLFLAASPSPRRIASAESVISQLEDSAPERAQLLRDFHERFERKEILPTADDLRSLAQQLGAALPDGRRTRKNEMIILMALSSLSVDILRDIIQSLVGHSGRAPSSLQQWHDIITRNRLKTASTGQPPTAG